MADIFELTAEVRNSLGKGASRRLRRVDNQIPGIVYGAGKEPMAIMISYHLLNNALKNEAFYSHILTLHLGKNQEKVVLKAMHRHPSKPQILHVDFQRVSATEKLYMNIPLHFINEDQAPGVKLEKGVISHLMNEVEIRCLPADLPEFIEVDLANLHIDQSIHLSELKIPKGVEVVALIHNDDRPVVNIHEPHVIEEPEETAAPVSPEVPVIGKEEGEEEAAAEGEKEGK